MDQNFIDQVAERLSKLGAKRPLGFHYAHPFGTVPADSIQCNGAAYNRALYKDFFAYITEQGWVKPEAEWQEIALQNNGYCPWYSDGDGTTTFRTPKFAPFMQAAIASGNVGNYHEAGLPNITGSAYSIQSGTTVTASGALTYTIENHLAPTISNGGMPFNRLSVDASKSSAVYGKSATVQPESHEWMICVVVMGVATNVGSADVGDVMSAVAQVQADVGTKEYVVASGENYVRYNNGLQLCWGEASTGPTDIAVTLPVPYKDISYEVTLAVMWGIVEALPTAGYYRNSGTNFNIVRTNGSAVVSWCVTGRWK